MYSLPVRIQKETVTGIVYDECLSYRNVEQQKWVEEYLSGRVEHRAKSALDPYLTKEENKSLLTF